ncbi:MAG: Na/Pi symporter [Verrucomicrobiota bacterium]
MDAIFQAIGGFGLFLFGMGVMTSGLKKLAGKRLADWLGRATRTPLSGSITGATFTAIVQSSSATTVLAIGFVGAGLITFSQSLGILFGANIGTTVTGWIIAVVGFKLKLGTAALPLLLIASLLYMSKKHPMLRGFGKALAGFSLIFLGISFLQAGLAGTRDWIDLSNFDASSISGRLVLLLLGAILTLITQSSSATVAVALTALNAGVIDLPQAAAFIIGADIGTTATAALATIGGNTASRRTGFAHVIYNLFTGIAAFLSLPLYLWLWNTYAPEMTANSPEIVAVAFHTTFNFIGVVVALPFTYRFAHFIERLFPEREDPLSASLNQKLLANPDAAISALETSARAVSSASLQLASILLSDGNIHQADHPPKKILTAISKARAFAISIGKSADEEGLDLKSLFALLHVIDHCERLTERLLDSRFDDLEHQEEFQEISKRLAKLFTDLATGIDSTKSIDLNLGLNSTTTELELDKNKIRAHLISRAAKGELTDDELDQALDGARWLRRLAYHSWRMEVYWREIQN